MQYEHKPTSQAPASIPRSKYIVNLPTLEPSLVLEDDVLRQVRAAWEKIAGGDGGRGFMMFEDRDGTVHADEDE